MKTTQVAKLCSHVVFTFKTLIVMETFLLILSHKKWSQSLLLFHGQVPQKRCNFCCLLDTRDMHVTIARLINRLFEPLTLSVFIKMAQRRYAIDGRSLTSLCFLFNVSSPPLCSLSFSLRSTTSSSSCSSSSFSSSSDPRLSCSFQTDYLPLTVTD